MQVQVDTARADELLARIGAQAEADQFAADQKFEKSQQAMAVGESEPDSWLTFARQSVDFTARAVCPAWELTGDERQMAAESVAEVLDFYFPGAVQGFDKWHPLSKLAGTLFFIAVSRFDFERGRMMPLKKADDDEHGDAPGRRADPDNGQEPQRKNAGHFAIGA